MSNILIVENDPQWKDILANWLKHYNCTIVSNFEEAKEIIEEDLPINLIIINLNLQAHTTHDNRDLLGVKFLRYLEEIKHPTWKLIFTGVDDIRIQEWMSTLGVSDIFVKGKFNEDRFVSTIEKLLHKKLPYNFHFKLERSEDYYIKAIGAIESNKKIIGTIFHVIFNMELYFVTCAHTLKVNNIKISDEIDLNFFIDDYANTKSKVVWSNTSDVPAELWTAEQDIALLKPVSNLPKKIKSLKINSYTIVEEEMGSYFSYHNQYGNKGIWNRNLSISLLAEPGAGFKALKGQASRKGITGDSGAPFRNSDGSILGMIQSLSDDIFYLIPVNSIINVINKYKEVAND